MTYLCETCKIEVEKPEEALAKQQVCAQGHRLTKLRKPFEAFFQGAFVPVMVWMVGRFVAKIYFGGTRSAAVTFAVVTALVSVGWFFGFLLKGFKYRQKPAPLSKLAVPAFWSAAGALGAAFFLAWAFWQIYFRVWMGAIVFNWPVLI